MADVLIKGLALPKNCDDCFACQVCFYESYDYCNILKDTTIRGERRNDCPLIEVKEVKFIQEYQKKLYMEV